MPERPGRWDLLERPSDPVVADTAAIDEQVQHFRTLADAMRIQGDRLARIGSGESLRGAYADELRSSATEVAKDLRQTVGRYEAAAGALRDYRPAVDVALIGSAAALDEAMDAAGAQGRAEAMPMAIPESGASLTPEQEQANADKTAATENAAAKLREARARLNAVLAQLDDAGRAAAATIRGGFNDGLKDSGWDRFKFLFVQILKFIVKWFSIVAMALAALALFLPGVGPIIAAALMTASRVFDAIAVAAEVLLVGLGEGDLEDLGWALLGLVTFGAGKAIGKARKAASDTGEPGSRTPTPEPDGAPTPPPRAETPEPAPRADTPEPAPRPDTPPRSGSSASNAAETLDAARAWGVPPGSVRVDPPADLVERGLVKPGTTSWQSPSGAVFTRLESWQGFRGSDVPGAERTLENGPQRIPGWSNGSDDPNWKALYVAETESGAAGYAKHGEMGEDGLPGHGDIIRYEINRDFTLVQPPRQIGKEDDPFAVVPELDLDGGRPFVDALGDKGIILRNPLPQGSGDTYEWAVPWDIASQADVRRHGRFWADPNGTTYEWTPADDSGNVTQPPRRVPPPRVWRDL
ncbi:hypothetical protein [Microbacterium oleivorans]|uniref:hypothetical protein n=1 Tax=Microbacterium oleivorans TaxID=273677 RepID=UPI0011472870|nr:hypothetical protein [Microbacterium oleivorans]